MTTDPARVHGYHGIQAIAYFEQEFDPETARTALVAMGWRIATADERDVKTTPRANSRLIVREAIADDGFSFSQFFDVQPQTKLTRGEVHDRAETDWNRSLSVRFNSTLGEFEREIGMSHDRSTWHAIESIE